MGSKKSKTKACLVRDRSGVFYDIPEEVLEKYAIEKPEDLKAAAEAYKAGDAEVSKKSMWPVMPSWSKMTGW